MSKLAVIEAPTVVPPMRPLKLVTMTVQTNVNTYLNLDVVSTQLALDSMFVGIKCKGVVRGQVENEKSQTMKNVCSFNCNMGKKINAKLFNNGKINNVGCLDPEQGVKITQHMVKRLSGLHGVVFYKATDYLTTVQEKNSNPKKAFKEFCKRYSILIPFLVQDLQLVELDALMFVEPELTYRYFANALKENELFLKEFNYLVLVIEILKKYFPEDTLGLEYFDMVQVIVTLITACTNDDQTIVTGEFPAYVSEIPSYDNSYRINLINKGTHCNFYVNRDALHRLITSDHTHVCGADYDMERYAGVIIRLKMPQELVINPKKQVIKVIIFNTGKINITSTQTHEQVQYAYNYISTFLKDHFNEVLFRIEYENKKRDYEALLPNKYPLKELENGSKMFLLNKRKILSNPRNVRLLNDLGLLQDYKVAS